MTDVLQLINTTFELDYYWDGNVCHVGKVQHDLTDTPIKYGSSDALISVSKENANYKIVDMITGYHITILMMMSLVKQFSIQRISARIKSV